MMPLTRLWPVANACISRARCWPLVLVLAVCLASLAGCLTPSVPIPPPEPEKMTFAHDPVDGTATFTFDPDATYALAVVYVFNRDKGLGIIETARIDGSVGPTRPFAADLNDRILISFELPTQLATTCVELRDGRSSSAYECGY